MNWEGILYMAVHARRNPTEPIPHKPSSRNKSCRGNQCKWRKEEKNICRGNLEKIHRCKEVQQFSGTPHFKNGEEPFSIYKVPVTILARYLTMVSWLSVISLLYTHYQGPLGTE